MRVFFGGVWVVFFGEHVWFFPGDVCGFFRGWGVGMVFQGVCMVFSGCEGCAWFFPGGMHGFFPGGVRVFFWGGVCVGYDQIRSMSGWYASYWNAFLLK